MSVVTACVVRAVTRVMHSIAPSSSYDRPGDFANHPIDFQNHPID